MVKFKQSKKNYLSFCLLMCLSGLIIACFGFQLNAYAFHNIDLGHNMNNLECEFDTAIIDYASDGNTYTGIELVNIGSNYNRVSVWIIFAGVLMFMGGLSDILGYIKI